MRQVIRTTISGSYHRSPEQLQAIYQELTMIGCQILSPFTPTFDDTSVPFPETEQDKLISHDELERRHLTAILYSDFVWLHAPSGYIGLAGSFELGFATAHNKPVFSFEPPEDEVLRPFVRVVPSIFRALAYLDR